MPTSARPRWLIRTVRWTGFTVAGLAVLAFVTWLGVPPLAKHVAEQQIEQQLGRKATIGKISFNPLTLTLTVADFTLYETDKTTPALSAKQLLVNASATSIFRLAPVLQQVTLSAPSVHIIRTSAEGIGRYNFSDIIDRILAKPKSEGETRFSISNIQLENGTITFDDKVTNKHVNIVALNVGLPYISNFQSAVDIFVQPSLSMKVNGAPLSLKGRTKPFTSTLDTALAIDIDQLDVASYVGFSPVPLPLAIQSSKLSTNLDLTFVRNKNKPEINLSGDVKLNDIALADMHAAPLFKAQSIEAHINKLDLLNASVAMGKINVQSPEVWAALQADGSLNWSALGAAKAPTDSASDANKPVVKASATAPQFTLNQFNIHDGIINWSDAANASPAFNTQLKNLTLDVSHLSLAANAKPANVLLSTGTDGTQEIKFAGQVTPATATVNGQASIAELALAPFQPYLNKTLSADLSGQLSLKTLVTINGGTVALNQFEAEVSDAKLAAKSRANGSVLIKKIKLEDASVNTQNATFNATAFNIVGMQADVRRDAKGNINLAQFINTAAPTRKAAKAPATKASGPEWVANLAKITITDSAITYNDNAVVPAVKLRADGINLTLDNISSKRDKTVKIGLVTKLNKSGKLTINGSAAPQFKSLDLAIDGQGLPIAALQPYFTQLLNVTLTTGQANAKGKLQLTPPEGKKDLIARYNGMLRLTNFRVVDKENGADFLKWKSLDVSGINASIDGPRQNVTLGKIALDDFYARAILSPEGRLNLQDIAVSKAGNKSVVTEPATTSGPKKSEASPANPAAANEATPNKETTAVADAGDGKVAKENSAAIPLTAPDPKANAPVIRIGQVLLKNGNINFTDNFIKPNYTANMTGMNGSIGAVASDKPAPAPIDINGKIDDDAPVAISGSLNPLFKPMFLDIKASANGVELPRLTPYAAKYAGYAIVKGKLSMDVNYKVEEQELTAQNHVRIDQLTFGDKIDSPSATKLPVRLAVALLKDRNGQIDINLPISGSLSDPKFSVGGIILRVFVNLIVKAVTSPFALLSSAFGGGDELGYAEFKPGSAVLTTDTKAKLDTLTKALLDRPALKLDIIGRVDPVADTAGVRQEILNRKLAALKQKSSGTKAKPDAAAEDDADVDTSSPSATKEVALTDADKTQLMEKVYKSEKFDKPRNAIGFAKSLPAPEMEHLILTNTKVTPDDLRSLADQRAQAVRSYLETKSKIPLERIFLIAPKLSADGIKDKGAPTRVDFALR
ncbi:DUF748 domain-containing protein [Glaciimonas sp. PCH181]|uniref:DUF748 domain-containing protein n=1 Tax=Glaciimonas sp. PCH181 TaxID=2133943 RepID=UPI000D3334C5|nr:DUF748 domain-containing protein [Glaciimonas sp. PCH181]PUA17245.1 hypothetical protein C7W93_15035 [Glaciimonas sp. PCH181]